VQLVQILCLGLESPGLTTKNPKSESSIEVNGVLVGYADPKCELLDPLHLASSPCRFGEQTMADASATEVGFDVEAPESGLVTELGWLFTYQADHADEFVRKCAYNDRVAAECASRELAPHELGLECRIGIERACESERVCFVGVTAEASHRLGI